MLIFNGYIKLHRKMLEWEWYTDGIVKAVFLHLLLLASFKDSKWQGENVNPGQIVIGRKKIAEDLGISEQNVRTALQKLKSTGEITSKSTNRFSLITIVNWRLYQDFDEKSNQQSTNNQPTNNQQITTSEECKEYKEDKEINSGDGDIYTYMRTREEISDGIDTLIFTLKRIENLPKSIKTLFRKTVNSLCVSFWGRKATDFDYVSVFNILVRFHINPVSWSEGIEFKMTRDDIELLSIAYEASAKADKKNLAYITGVFNKFRERGIRTADDYWEFEDERN